MDPLDRMLVRFLLPAALAIGFIVATGAGDLRPWFTAALAVLCAGVCYLWRRTESPAWEIGALASWLALLVPCVAIVSAIPLFGPAVLITTPILLALYAWFWWKHRERRVWGDTGHCRHCGYDLRASGDRCPECGNEIDSDKHRRRRIAAELNAKRSSTTSETTPFSAHLEATERPDGDDP